MNSTCQVANATKEETYTTLTRKHANLLISSWSNLLIGNTMILMSKILIVSSSVVVHLKCLMMRV